MRVRLKALGIYQYFFPPADQLLLGLADNDIKVGGSLVRAAEEAPRYGHPIGPSELFRDTATLGETLEELKGRGYIAEGEIEEVITDEGRTVRKIKIRPSESLFSKLSKLINVKVDISTKDIFKPEEFSTSITVAAETKSHLRNPPAVTRTQATLWGA